MKKPKQRDIWKELREVRAWLTSQKIPYTVATTGSSAQLIYCGRKMHFTSGDSWKGKQFQLLARIKAAAVAAVRAGKCTGRKRPEYYRINYKAFPLGSGEIKCREIDLRAAYPTAAIRLRIIPRDLHVALMKQPKKFRTRLLGAIASTKEIRDVDANGKVSAPVVKFNREGRAVWREICHRVGGDLGKVADWDNGFLAFWVDNYFTTTPACRVSREISDWYRLRSKREVLRYVNDGLILTLTTSTGRVFRYPLCDRPTAARANLFDRKALTHDAD